MWSKRATRSLYHPRHMFELATETVLLLMLASFAAGFIDSIAGGGGLIVIPALLLAGMTPIDALGTNKLGGMFGSGSATLAYAAKGHVKLREQSAGRCFRPAAARSARCSPPPFPANGCALSSPSS